MFQKPKGDLKTVGFWRMIWSKFNAKDPEILGPSVQN
jgi:hypothetical protein